MNKTEEMVAKAIARAEEMMYDDYRIHYGVERKAVAKEWKGERIYINIYCYSLAGNYKGKYDCGYVEKATGEYKTNQYTQIELF